MGLMTKVADIWAGRYLVLGSLVAFLAAGAFYTWWIPPTYQADAMLQIQPKKERSSDQAFSKMEGLFNESEVADAEVELLQSNLVLGRTAETLALDIVAEPKVMRVIGAALARRNPYPPLAEIESFQVPDYLRGEVFLLTALSGGAFRWDAPGGAALATGKPGETLTGGFQGETLRLKVRKLSAKPGQVFKLFKRPMPDVVDELRKGLDVSQKGKLTNIIGLSFRGADAAKCAQILNQIMDEYVRHKVEKRKNEIAKAQEILKEQMPELKVRLEAAEDRLNQFRKRAGAVDLMREAGIYLDQRSSLDGQITALRQRREDLLRTYNENSDLVTTVDQQIAKLQQQLGQVDSKVRILPGTQQELVRLSRDVQVETELYTALLNNIQQMQVSSAGEIGNITIVDQAVPSPDPIAPNKPVLMMLFFMLGSAAGVGSAVVRRILRSGVQDYRLIESKLDLPVFVAIPHSKAQEEHNEAIQKGAEGAHLLAVSNGADLAMESLRSLRTMLNFSIKDARNPVVMITGPSPSIGKSFVSANFAAVLAQSGAKVLVVDGDLRKGNLHRYFGFKNRLNGLSDVLSGQRDWKSVLQPTEVTGLTVISSGLLPPNPSELLMTPRFSTFISEASGVYDYILIDAPPALPVTDSSIIASNAATILLIAKFGQNPLDEIRAAQQRFEIHGMKVKGCVFNDIKLMGWGQGYGYGNYIYHYGYKK